MYLKGYKISAEIIFQKRVDFLITYVCSKEPCQRQPQPQHDVRQIEHTVWLRNEKIRVKLQQNQIRKSQLRFRQRLQS